jgi:Rhomboid-like protein
VVLVTVLALVLVPRLLLSERWPQLEPLRRRWRRASPHVRSFVRAAPATYTYLFVLLITAWVLQTSSPRIAQRLVLERSTNLHHLAHDPVRVLIASAFWVAHAWEVLPWAVLFTLVLAPAEQWLGTARWAIVFAAGHIGATLLTAAGLWLAIRADAVDASAAHSADVGVSYGFLAIAGVLTYRLPRRWRPAYVLLLGGYILVAAFTRGTFTDAGHALALAIGLALYPVAQRVQQGHEAVTAAPDQPPLSA